MHRGEAELRRRRRAGPRRIRRRRGADAATADAATDGAARDAARDAALDAGLDAAPPDAETDAGRETDAGPPCPTGTGDCDDDPSNGCETDLTSDDAHCGSCTMACASDRSCIEGTCRTASITSVALGATHTCISLSTGHARCWGRDHVGQLGDCVVGSPDRHAAAPVADTGARRWPTCTCSGRRATPAARSAAWTGSSTAGARTTRRASAPRARPPRCTAARRRSSS
ncbi:MAG: RCC1 domain-containing protein [Sandaracinaceae bacterium]|nr:RCC1 domain-containing protein [Sandaracinaceae bacterium]